MSESGNSRLFRVATYNLENYLDGTSLKGRPKSAESKAKIHEALRIINADVLVVQEMGSTDIFQEFRASLASEGMEFREAEYVSVADADLHIAILSKFPFIGRRHHADVAFSLNGKQHQVRRGFAEVDVEANRDFCFTFIAAHLKSKNQNAEVNASQWRLEEAKLLREIIEARLKDPGAKVLVAGDFNDEENSDVLKTIIGQGGGKLLDAKPAERNCGVPAKRAAAWTNCFEEMSIYERIDYFLMSKAMTGFWLPEESYVLAFPDWRMASDHRPVVVAFDPGKHAGQRLRWRKRGAC